MADNPQAFPTSASNPGMSLRDYFAGKALVGFLADSSQREINAACLEEPDFLDKGPDARSRIVNEQLAAGCYALADAMLAARKSGQPS